MNIPLQCNAEAAPSDGSTAIGYTDGSSPRQTSVDLAPLTVFNSASLESQMVSRHLEDLGRSRGELSILEAGCGTAWPLKLPHLRYRLTGIDANEAALKARQQNQGDLQHAILGDLRTVELNENEYDVIYNSFVLEHVASAERVLENFRRWLAPGGILILRIPDPHSVYGWLSRVTPFWLHVAYKRYIAGYKNAGKPGYDPFPTVYDSVVSRAGIHRWCAASGMTIRKEVGWNYAYSRAGLTQLASLGVRVVRLLSVGRLASDHINLTYIIEKTACGSPGGRTAQSRHDRASEILNAAR